MIIQRTVIDPIVGTAILVGDGTPVGLDAPTGSIFVRKDGGSNQMVYVKYGNTTSDWQILGSGSGGTSVSSSYALTSSFATTAISASYALTSSFATTASAATSITFTPVSASYALTASFAANAGTSGLKTKAGSVLNSAFGSTPLTASVTFSSAFANTNYGIIVTGEDARAWTIQNKATTGFVINTNSKVGLSGTTYWTATAYGES